jgi:hypothetical protein
VNADIQNLSVFLTCPSSLSPSPLRSFLSEVPEKFREILSLYEKGHISAGMTIFSSLSSSVSTLIIF